MLRLAFLFVLLIVYGSLYPFDQWADPAAPPFTFLLHWPVRIDHADLVQNVLAYAPFGLFLALARLRTQPPRAAILQVMAAAAALSTVMECVQQFEPARTASTADIAMNVLGALAGAVLALLFIEAAAPAWPPLHRLQRLRQWRHARFRRGTLPNIGLAALALWALAQASPLVPALDPGHVSRNLARLAWQLRHPLTFNLSVAMVAALQLSGLGLLMRSLLPAAGRAAVARVLAGLLAAVFAAKLVVYGRSLPLEELAGAACALVVAGTTRHTGERGLAWAGAASLLGGFVLSELVPATAYGGFAGFYRPFNWVPLAGQMRSLAGLENILELFWPFFALAYFVRLLMPAAPLRRRTQTQGLGAMLVLALVFALEWQQQLVPGRYGDITQVLLAVGGWLLPWSFRSADFSEAVRLEACGEPDHQGELSRAASS